MGLKMTGRKSIFITGAASGMGKATAAFFKAKD
jgi:NADP-dependent 3-hydroxy acid dehydrogenase YdfG